MDHSEHDENRNNDDGGGGGSDESGGTARRPTSSYDSELSSSLADALRDYYSAKKLQRKLRRRQRRDDEDRMEKDASRHASIDIRSVAVKLLVHGQVTIITFCVSRRRHKMYCGHPRLCVCLSVRDRTPTLLHGPGCNLGAW